MHLLGTHSENYAILLGYLSFRYIFVLTVFDLNFLIRDRQLPVLTLSGSSHNRVFGCSLFERLQTLNFPTILLRAQYRMHEDIAEFPSREFYNGKLITPEIVNERPRPAWIGPCFPTVCFWDTHGLNTNNSGRSRGFENHPEASFITRSILSTLSQSFFQGTGPEITVGIISFYRDQVSTLTIFYLFLV